MKKRILYMLMFSVILVTGSISHAAESNDLEQCFQIFLKAKKKASKPVPQPVSSSVPPSALVKAACNKNKIAPALKNATNKQLESERDSIGKTLAMIAASKGASNVLAYLITRNINFKQRDPHENTLLRWAMNCPKDDIVSMVKKVLTLDTSVNKKDTLKGRTPLQWLLRRHEAAVKKQADQLPAQTVYQVAQLLLNVKDANPMITDSTEKSALYWASSYDDTKLATLLTCKAKDKCKALSELIAGAMSSKNITTYAHLKDRVNKYIQQISDQKIDVACIIQKIGHKLQNTYSDAKVKKTIKTIIDDLIIPYKTAQSASAPTQQKPQPENPLMLAMELLKLKLLLLAKKVQKA